MASYELTEAADTDLSDIYAFTFTEFGELQADAYFESLEESLERLADSPGLGREIGFVRSNYRLFVHRRHSFYTTRDQQQTTPAIPSSTSQPPLCRRR